MTEDTTFDAVKLYADRFTRLLFLQKIYRYNKPILEIETNLVKQAKNELKQLLPTDIKLRYKIYEMIKKCAQNKILTLTDNIDLQYEMTETVKKFNFVGALVQLN
jgi:hypothetical protein